MNSSHFHGAAVVSFFDPSAQVIRISCVPADNDFEEDHAILGSTDENDSPFSSAKSASERSPTPGRVHGKKSKIPRPPNAFILYRQKYHPILKAQRPDMHNNDISVILGKQWKAESATVKADFKAKAEEMKRQHARAHPGYQYAPRKPSEKKRRMTAKKIAKISSDTAQSVQSSPSATSQMVADDEQYESENVAQMAGDVDDLALNNEDQSGLNFAQYIGNDRPPNAGSLHFPSQESVAVTLPAENGLVMMRDLDNMLVHPNDVMGFTVTSLNHVTSTVPQHVVNDHDFFNSLIDWEGIQADAELVRASTTESLVAIDGTEVGNSRLLLSDEAYRRSFEAELERTLHMFE